MLEFNNCTGQRSDPLRQRLGGCQHAVERRGKERAGEGYIAERQPEDDAGKRYDDDVGNKEIDREAVEGGNGYRHGGEGGGYADNGRLPQSVTEELYHGDSQ